MTNVTFGAAANATFGNCDSFAATWKPDASKTKRITAALSKETNVEVAKATLNDSGTVFQFLYVGPTNKTNVVTRPFPATDEFNAAVTLAGRGDAMDILSPALLSTKMFHGYVITLLSTEDANELKLTTTEEDPLQLDDPSGGVEETKDEDEPIVIEDPATRIGWKKVTGPSDQPVFAALRVMLPIPLGIKPPVNLDITKDTLPPSFNQGSYPALRIWYSGMQYLFKHNQNLSLHSNRLLFKPDEIDPESLFTTLGYPLVTHARVPVRILYEDADHLQYHSVLTILRAEKRTAIMRMAENANIPRERTNTSNSSTSGSSSGASSTAGSPSSTRGPPSDADGYKAMFDGLAASKFMSNGGGHDNTKLSLKEKEQISESEDVIAQYQLLFARVTKGTNAATGVDTEVLVFPKISGQFTQFLTTHRASKATSILQAHIQSHTEMTGRSDTMMDTLANLEPMMFDAVFATTLRKFGWATETPNVCPHTVERDIGIYHFAPVRTESHLFSQRVEHGRLMIRQEELEEDKSRREQKITELYHFGLMKTREDILCAMANFYAFAKYMIDDMETDVPTVITALMSIVKCINSLEGRRFGKQFRKHPEVFHGILMDTQQVLNTFTRIATRYEYRQAVLNSNAISTTAYTVALVSCQLFTNKIYNATTQMSMDTYNLIPLSMALFQPPSENKKKAAEKSQREAGAGKAMDIDAAPDKVKDPPTKKKKFGKGTPGILRWDGKGNIPFPNVWTTKTDGSKQKLCANFAFQDRVCNKPNCTYFHAKTKCELEPSVLVDLEKWVANKDQVEFVSPGEAPCDGQ
jgi:hypothetical protein